MHLADLERLAERLREQLIDAPSKAGMPVDPLQHWLHLNAEINLKTLDILATLHDRLGDYEVFARMNKLAADIAQIKLNTAPE